MRWYTHGVVNLWSGEPMGWDHDTTIFLKEPTGLNKQTSRVTPLNYRGGGKVTVQVTITLLEKS